MFEFGRFMLYLRNDCTGIKNFVVLIF